MVNDMSVAFRARTSSRIARPAGWLAALALCLLLFFAPNGAFAHAALVGSEPVDGALLASPPARLLLTFSEPVSPLILTLFKPGGQSLPLTDFRQQGRTLVFDRPPLLGKGSHVLNWRVVSGDGHPVGGSIVFSIGAPSASPPQAVEPVDWTLRSAVWTGRLFLYIGLFLGVGGAFALAWLSSRERPGRSFVVAASLCGLIAAVLSIGLQGLDGLGAPLRGLMRPVVWKTGWDTTFGWTALIALAALLLGLLSLAVPRRWAKLLAIAGLLGVGAALAASGHASAAEPQWLTRSMVFLHGVGIAFWTGALAPLGLALKRRSADAEPFLRRFSVTIPLVVAVLAAAGVVLAVIQVRTPSALLDTAYGRLLLVKLALLVVLFALAAVNRWKLTADGSRRPGLVRSIGFEVLIVLAVFGVAAGWRFTPPPRALAIAAAQPATSHVHTLAAMADLSITPGHAGKVAARIVIMTGDFGPLDAKEVTLVLSKSGSGIEPLKRPAKKSNDGTWRIDDFIIPVPGRWAARIEIVASDMKTLEVEGPIDIRQ